MFAVADEDEDEGKEEKGREGGEEQDDLVGV